MSEIANLFDFARENEPCTIQDAMQSICYAQSVIDFADSVARKAISKACRSSMAVWWDLHGQDGHAGGVK